jgi:hypothetical protein
MAANTVPIFPATPYTITASLVAASACTSRGPVAIAAVGDTPVFAVALVPVSTNGIRIDKIQVKGCATAIAGATTAGSVIVWLSSGVTVFPIDEILIPVVTPSASVASVDVAKEYTKLVLKATDTLWVSSTIAGVAAAHALCVTAYGGAY